MNNSLIHAYRIALSWTEYKQNSNSLLGFLSEKIRDAIKTPVQDLILLHDWERKKKTERQLDVILIILYTSFETTKYNAFKLK